MDRPKRDDVIEVDVTDLAFGGQGVARAEGFVLFCDDTAPGDRARVQVRKARRRFAEARLMDVLEPGPSRVTPPCSFVPRCGGCRLQHIAYGATLEAKRNQIVEHLSRIGHLTDITVKDTIPAVEPFGYRNKMEYSAAPGRAAGIALGFHERGRWDSVIDIDPCLLATSLGNALRESVRSWADDEGIVPYEQRSQTGVLRHVVVRVGITTDQALVSVVTTPGAEAVTDRLGPRLSGAHPELVGLVHAVNDGVAEVTGGLPSRTVWGRDWIEERIHGVTLRLSAGAFFQTNTRMAETLYAHAATAAGLTGNEVLYDLYAGTGSVGLILAAAAREVVAIEIVEDAVRDAEASAAANGLANYRAIAGDVRVVLRERRDELPPPDVVIVDPPRAGLSGGAVRRILELSPPVLVYISCHPATFADNAARFVAGGYRLEWVQPVDMFPQTPHIEAVARFVWTGAPPPPEDAPAAA
jgi:23S rRNA (uracil1939-C5)-methyltransferase